MEYTKALSALVMLTAVAGTAAPANAGHSAGYGLSVSAGTGSAREINGVTDRFDQFGADIARTDRWSPYTRLRYGLQGYGYRGERRYDTFPDDYVYGARAFVGGECRWAGLELGVVAHGIGARYGEIQWLPSGRLRLGPSDYGYAELLLIAQRQGYRPWAKLGIGTSHWDWCSVSLGLSEVGVYVEPEFRTGFGLELSPFISYGDRNIWQLSFRVAYELRNFSPRP